jgi:hypothetical protein
MKKKSVIRHRAVALLLNRITSTQSENFEEEGRALITRIINYHTVRGFQNDKIYDLV